MKTNLRPMKSTYGIGATAAAIAAGALVLMPTTAYAGQGNIGWFETTDGPPQGIYPGAKAKFTASGDKVTICDIDNDGWYARGLVYGSDGMNFKYTFTVGGEGRCRTVGASKGGVYNLLEGGGQWIKICIQRKGAERKACETRTN